MGLDWIPLDSTVLNLEEELSPEWYYGSWQQSRLQSLKGYQLFRHMQKNPKENMGGQQDGEVHRVLCHGAAWARHSHMIVEVFWGKLDFGDVDLSLFFFFSEGQKKPYFHYSISHHLLSTYLFQPLRLLSMFLEIRLSQFSSSNNVTRFSSILRILYILKFLTVRTLLNNILTKI